MNNKNLIKVNPIVSVITVSLNNCLELEKTINSVLLQSYKYIDFIVIDGGSVDGSIDILKKSESKIKFWISEKDFGIYDAMNKGILNSNGDFINFLNAGDYYYNNEVLKIVAEEIHRNNEVELIYGLSENFSISERLNYFSGNELDENILWKGMPVCHQSMFFNKKIFKNIGLYDLTYKNMADYEFLLRYFKSSNNRNMVFIEKPLSRFNLYGLSDSDYLGSLKEIESISKKYYVFNFTRNIYFILKHLKYYFLQVSKKIGIHKIYRKIKYKIFSNKSSN